MEEGDAYIIAWGFFEYDTNNFYGIKLNDSPISSKEGWSPKTPRDEDLPMTIQAPFIEIVAIFESAIVII